MSWICKLVDYTDEWIDLPVGSMFFAPTADDTERCGLVKLYCNHLSDHYKIYNSHRPPLFVMLPGNVLFCIDGQCQSNGQFYGGWTVTGDASNITVSPSINMGSTYHGFLQNGVISDDVEGRKYGEDGYRIRDQNVSG